MTIATGDRRRSAGFTLMEAVVVMVITGILSAITAIFIIKPIEGYADSVRRAELTDQADLVARRFAREVRLAVPNSVRVQDSAGNASCSAAASVPSTMCYIEFILTSGGGRYRDCGTVASGHDGSNCTGTSSLSFTSSAQLAFDVLGPMPTDSATPIAQNDYIIVNNLGPAYAASSADAYSGGNRAQVDSLINGNTTIKMKSPNPFAGRQGSPNFSFQWVRFANRAVTYECPVVTPGSMNRYAAYGFNASMAKPPNATPSLMAPGVTCEVALNASTDPVTKGLLSLKLTLSDLTSQERVPLFREIHVDNVP